MKKLPAVRIDARCYRRVSEGYPWIFRSEIVGVKEASAIEPGSIVDFVREKGDFVARGFYNPLPQLVGRVLTRGQHENIDAEFVKYRIQKSLAYRDALYKEPYYRVIHAEADGFPGMIVDRYGDVIVAQVNTAGMEKLFPLVESALASLIKPKAIILRNDTASREQEGLAQEVKGVVKAPVKISENGVSFSVDVMEGQKTGWFFDQRDNRAWVAGLAKNKSMIDIFCHTGGFGVTAAVQGASAVTFIDSSEKALAGAKENAALNGVEKKCEFIDDKAFEAMEKLAGKGKKYGVVCADPPAFIKSRKDMNSGLKGYQKLARLAEPLVEKGGFLFLASCSHHAEAKELLENVAEGLSKCGRPFQLVKTSGAGADHPVHPLLPETGYLKALTFRFLD